MSGTNGSKSFTNPLNKFFKYFQNERDTCIIQQSVYETNKYKTESNINHRISMKGILVL